MRLINLSLKCCADYLSNFYLTIAVSLLKLLQYHTKNCFGGEIGMKDRLKKMKLSKRLNYGYAVVIAIMVLSGIMSIIGLGVIFGNFKSYVSTVNMADSAAKQSIILDPLTTSESCLAASSAAIIPFSTALTEVSISAVDSLAALALCAASTDT